MTANLADRHATGVHGDDLLVEVREPTLVFGDQLRGEGARSVARNIERHLRSACQDRLLRPAVAAVGFSIRGFRIEMRVKFPFVDAYRTICTAPEPEFMRLLEDVRDFQTAA